jgi:hypothetical protein
MTAVWGGAIIIINTGERSSGDEHPICRHLVMPLLTWLSTLVIDTRGWMMLQKAQSSPLHGPSTNYSHLYMLKHRITIATDDDNRMILYFRWNFSIWPRFINKWDMKWGQTFRVVPRNRSWNNIMFMNIRLWASSHFRNVKEHNYFNDTENLPER